MKMTTMFVVAVFTLAVLPAQAASKLEVWDLLEQINVELRNYPQNPRQLDLVKEKLTVVLSTMRGRNITEPAACEDFAYTEYLKDGYSNSISLERAQTFCQTVSVSGLTMPVIKFFFLSLKKDGFSTSLALDNTITLAANVNESDLPCVRKAYGRYRKDKFGARLSLQKSVELCLR